MKYNTVNEKNIFEIFDFNKDDEDRGKIKVFPKYQRKYITVKKKKCGFIKSLLNEEYFGSIQVAKYEVNGVWYREVVDGTQRINMMREFFEGGFDVGGIKYSSLNTKDRLKIQYDFKVVNINIEKILPNNVFNVLNTANTTLDKMELLNGEYCNNGVYEYLKNRSQSPEYISSLCRIFDTQNELKFTARYKSLAYLLSILTYKSFNGKLVGSNATNRNQFCKNYIESGKLSLDNTSEELFLIFDLLSYINFGPGDFKQCSNDLFLPILGLTFKYFNTKSLLYKHQSSIKNTIVKMLSQIENNIIKNDNRGVAFHTGVCSMLDESFNNLLQNTKRKPFSKSYKLIKLKHQEYKCSHCKVDITEKTNEADHITPVHLGGDNSIENLQMLCRPCNRTKGGK